MVAYTKEDEERKDKRAAEFMPLLDPSEKDERFDGVVLLEGEGPGKVTAEDCGDYWLVRTWDLTTNGLDEPALYSDFGYTMYKKHAKKLLGL